MCKCEISIYIPGKLKKIPIQGIGSGWEAAGPLGNIRTHLQSMVPLKDELTIKNYMS